MKPTLAPGLVHEATLTVGASATVPNIPPHMSVFFDMPPVFATASMIAFIEGTCVECLAPHLDAGEHSVGIHVDVSHDAPTPAGMPVRARVALTAVDGRILTFAVEAWDAKERIGTGTHRRAVIDVARFLAKVALKG